MFWIYSLNWLTGIECISREAKKVTFAERDISDKTLKDNLIKHSIIKS